MAAQSTRSRLAARPDRVSHRMPNAVALRAVAILVLLPGTLVSGFGSLLGFAFVADSFRRSDHVAAGAVLLVAMAAGWFGLVTSWRLYYGLLRGRTGFDRRVAWAGLTCGSLVSLGLMVATGGSLNFRIVFFGWPLLAAAFFGIALWRLRPGSPSRPGPLPGSA